MTHIYFKGVSKEDLKGLTKEERDFFKKNPSQLKAYKDDLKANPTLSAADSKKYMPNGRNNRSYDMAGRIVINGRVMPSGHR